MTELRFQGLETGIDLTALVEREPRLTDLRDRLAARFEEGRPGSPERARARAQEYVESLLAAGIADFGNGYVKGRSAMLDRIVSLRDEITTSYASVLDTKGAMTVKPSEIGAKFKQLEELLANVRERADSALRKDMDRPALDEVAKRVGQEIEPTEPVVARPMAEATKARLQESGFSVSKRDGVARKRYARGDLEIRLGPDGRYQVRAFDPQGNLMPHGAFFEFDTLDAPYSEKPLSSRVMQAHHGCQDALMSQVFGEYGYDGKEAPTIWLRDSTGDSPHGLITHTMQNPNLEARLGEKPTVAKIRQWGAEDLAAVGAPPQAIARYLDAFDRYFQRKVLPNIPVADRPALLGDVPWK